MRIDEIQTKTALVRSRIPGVDYVINPYLGCAHGCSYCYATFMRKYAHHNRNTRWGDFVEVKVNIVDVLADELRRKRATGTANLSSVCDPYQPVEEKYRLARGCLQVLRQHGWGIEVLTRSPLILRDIDILSSCLGATVGLSIGTDDDSVRQTLEPNAPSIESRIDTLRKLHEAGIRTWAFVAPMLPMNPERLYELIHPHIDSVMMDGLNYASQSAALFRRHGWDAELRSGYAKQTRARLQDLFGEKMLK